MSSASKWQPIDTAPIDITIWVKREGCSLGRPYKKAKAVLSHGVRGVIATKTKGSGHEGCPIKKYDGYSTCWPITHWKPVKQSNWIVKNSKHIPIKDMSIEDAAEVFDAWRELQYIPHSNLQMWFELDNKWIVVGAGWHLTPIDIFRVKRKKSIEEGQQEVLESADNPTPNVPLWEVDWEEIPREYEWAAVDENGRAWLYEERPYTVGNIWDCHADMRELSIDEIVWVLGDVENNWKYSLTKRP